MNLLGRWFRARAQRKFAAWEGPLAERISLELSRRIPPHWNSALLILDASAQGPGTGVDRSVVSPEGHRDVVTPSDELRLATRLFELGCQERHRLWKKAYFKIDRVEAGWSFALHYLYD